MEIPASNGALKFAAARARNGAEGDPMPLYAYACRDCGETFETLVMSGETPICPTCASETLDQQLSLIAAPKRGGDAAPAFAGCSGGEMGACCGGCPMGED
jgi:putative FmdB family regulatory protein